MATKSSVNLLFLYEARGEMPTEVDLSECSIQYFDEKRNPELITGVYGTKSKQLALESMAKWNANHLLTPEQRAKGNKPSRLLMVDAHYSMASLEAQRQRASADVVESTGWLNLERVTPEMREELKQVWLTAIARSQGAAKARALEDEQLLKLVTDYPQYVSNLFRDNKKLVGVNHPIRPRFDPHVTLWVATVRLIPKRFLEVSTRYFDAKVHVR